MELRRFGWIFIPSAKDKLTTQVDHEPVVFCRECKYWQVARQQRRVSKPGMPLWARRNTRPGRLMMVKAKGIGFPSLMNIALVVRDKR